MNLTSLALRIATVEALRGATWANALVLDHPVDPIEHVPASAGPLIAVFTGVSGGLIDGRDIAASNNTVDLVIQVYLPPQIVINPEQSIDVFGRGGEIALDIIGSQIERALTSGTTVWQALWRSIVFDIVEAESKPYLIETREKTRIVAREITMTIAPIASPTSGKVEGVWSDFIAALTATSEPTLQGVVDIIHTAIVGEGELPPWRAAQAALGLTDAAANALGISPVAATPDGNAPPLTNASGVNINIDVVTP